MNTHVHSILRWSITACATFGALVFFGTQSAHALTISPPSIEFGVYPGQQAEITVKLYNEDASQTVQVTSETTTFTSGEAPGEPVFAESATATDISKWIVVDGGTLSLEPLARKNLSVKVNVPADAEPGGHYGAILFTFKNPNAPQDGQIVIDAKVATLLLVRVEGGEITESAAVQSFGVTGGVSRFSHLPVSFTTQYQNTGTIHLKPKGTITIQNSFGKQVATIDFNTEKGATLPSTTRRYDKEVWQVGEVQPVEGNAWARFWKSYKNERANFAIGKFTATLNVAAGSGDKVTSAATTTFWVLPIHVIIVYGFIIIVAIVLLIILITRYNAWIRKRAVSSPPSSNPPAKPKA